MTITQVTAPSSANPEIKAAAQEVNALARKLDAAVSRREMAYARFLAIKAETDGTWPGGPQYLQLQLVREGRMVHTAQRDIENLSRQHQQAMQRYRLMEAAAVPFAARILAKRPTSLLSQYQQWTRRLIAGELEFIPKDTITRETFDHYGWGDAEIEQFEAVLKSDRGIDTVLAAVGQPPIIIPTDEWPTFKAVLDAEFACVEAAS